MEQGEAYERSPWQVSLKKIKGGGGEKRREEKGWSPTSGSRAKSNNYNFKR